MKVARINSLSGSPLSEQIAELEAQLSLQETPSAFVIMIHGYKFDSTQRHHCPHATMFNPSAVEQDYRTLSWPDAFHMAPAGSCAIGFSWPARGRLKSVYHLAARAGVELGQLIKALRSNYPKTPIHLMAHSMGARVVLRAFHTLGAGNIERAILMFPAEYEVPSEAALNTDAGQTCEILTIASRENAFYEYLFSWMNLAGHQMGRAFGGYQPSRTNHVTVWIDRKEIIDALHSMDIQVGTRKRRLCHWSAYTRTGIFNLYARWLFHPRQLPITTLQRITATNTTRSNEFSMALHTPA